MPPKAKTPSEEAAMESPKLDQMLAMLQGMSEKISEFDLRMVAVEKSPMQRVKLLTRSKGSIRETL